ncbi:hypothetical protein BD289DRAFT_32545 [Coniella lustricola]|uniref:Carrier domain-containing protein n=1 Tax=Coniella lustricola TaxID=2025994 RepID=A0A2T3A2J9_9PEZI|nr:hypothetical protein BD289DRAFT_32545 [Coniella lustricola]
MTDAQSTVLESILARLGSAHTSSQDSLDALRCLSVLLRQTTDSSLVLPSIQCLAHIRRSLRRNSASNQTIDSLKLLQDCTDRIKTRYQSLVDFIPDTAGAALFSTDTQRYISHRKLRQFVHGFSLPIGLQISSKPVVAIALPNSALLAAVCIAVVTHYTAAPINPAAGAEQFQADVRQAGTTCILTDAESYSKLGLDSGWVRDEGIAVFLVDMSSNMNITMSTCAGIAISAKESAPVNSPDDTALVLFTSGTSGKKKLVPITTHAIVAGVAFVIKSWALSPDDVCLNMMPLYHVGGLIRNIFAPIFAGGSTVCCSAFDPNTFWDLVETTLPTWYYASPSMHSLILAESATRQKALLRSRIRLVCNAAGNLMPSLAIQLRDTFDSVVLPSYGMTECMPISTPPVHYRLDRPGTSGTSIGPDLAILNGNFEVMAPHTTGRICVRGEPLFPGYLQPDGTLDRSAISEEGWFDTGDLGYLDQDGYLYITGRSKEVINRGGELISPCEVEDAIMAATLKPESPLFARVTQVLAFSVPHDILQEVVGVVLVTSASLPRPDLRLLHRSLRDSLQQVKWPTLVVYMDDLPKRNNKVLRIKVAERLSLPQVTEDTPYILRHWEARCPAADTDLSVSIRCDSCTVSVIAVEKELTSLVPSDVSFHVQWLSNNHNMRVFLAPETLTVPLMDEKLPRWIESQLRTVLPGYMMPSSFQALRMPFPLDADGEVDGIALAKSLAAAEDSLSLVDDEWSWESRLATIFARILHLDAADIPSDADFFSIGGDSLKAGRLLSMLRADLDVHVPIAIIFQHGSVVDLAAYIRGQEPSDSDSAASTKQEALELGAIHPECHQTYSSRRWNLMFLQLLPMCVFYPMRRAYQWTIFMVFLAHTQAWTTADYVPGRLFNLCIAVLVSRIITRAVLPWVGIAAKWLLIGRYREGLYPMWGPYHTRWWLVQKIVDICGQGLFSQTNYTTCLYLRLMGARVGRNVSVRGVSVGEWDLLEIGDEAVLERCTLRPFAGERNTAMYLGRIRIGRRATVGMASIVSPGTTVPDETCLGANSSSWEAGGAEEGNRDGMLSSIPSGHWVLDWLVTKPLVTVCWIVSLIPWSLGLLGLVMTEPIGDQVVIYTILQWFAGPRRIGYHYLALVLRTLTEPFLLFACTVLFKLLLDTLFGIQKPTPAKGRGHVEKWRMSFMKTLFSTKRLHDMTELMGQHYEGTSAAIRLLGGRVGKRVYWPGTGPSIGDYHLLDIGDDVVFGSRAHIVTSDGLGSEVVRVGDRAMVADRVVLLPGVTIGNDATMGSGALTRRNKGYAEGGVYVGSKNGDAVCLRKQAPVETRHRTVEGPDAEDKLGMILEAVREKITGSPAQRSTNEPTTHHTTVDVQAHSTTDATATVAAASSPFGRAFYLHQAPYRVHTLPTIIGYSTAITVLVSIFWNVPSLSAVQIVALLFRTYHTHLGHGAWFDIPVLYVLFTILIGMLNSLAAALATALLIAAKWLLLGRRQPGAHDWDASPYCQTWQLYLALERLRRHCFRGHGILGMLTGTHWLVLYFRALGADIGEDVALFANGRPSLMFTEPDLVRIGARTVVDDASVVAHVNTRGRFALNRLEIGKGCVLRSGSRLLSGAEMRDGSVLLEHTLIMGGDVVGPGVTMQGWPAERFRGARVVLRAGEARDKVHKGKRKEGDDNKDLEKDEKPSGRGGASGRSADS